MLYRVMWDIELEADGPLDAAEEAQRMQRDPDSLATVYCVYDERGKLVDQYDLLEQGQMVQ